MVMRSFLSSVRFFSFVPLPRSSQFWKENQNRIAVNRQPSKAIFPRPHWLFTGLGPYLYLYFCYLYQMMFTMAFVSFKMMVGFSEVGVGQATFTFRRWAPLNIKVQRSSIRNITLLYFFLFKDMGYFKIVTRERPGIDYKFGCLTKVLSTSFWTDKLIEIKGQTAVCPISVTRRHIIVHISCLYLLKHMTCPNQRNKHERTG